MSICCGQAAKAIRKVQLITKAYMNHVNGVNKDISVMRMRICKGEDSGQACEFYKRGICTACGCVIEIKSTLQDNECDGGICCVKNKWPIWNLMSA